MGVDMFQSSDDFNFNDHFKGFNDDFIKQQHKHTKHFFGTMEIIITIVSVVGIIIVLILLCKCCQRNKHRGQIITPPPPPGTVTVAPYPQQQYVTPVMGSHTVVQTPYPPAPYPTGVYPHPAYAGNVSMPAPGPGVGGGPPYPTAYPHPQPQPSLAPSAPDANVFFGMAPPGWNSQALPPSYEQATTTDFKHSSPYNPTY